MRKVGQMKRDKKSGAEKMDEYFMDSKREKIKIVHRV